MRLCPLLLICLSTLARAGDETRGRTELDLAVERTRGDIERRKAELIARRKRISAERIELSNGVAERTARWVD